MNLECTKWSKEEDIPTKEKQKVYGKLCEGTMLLVP